MTIQQIIIDTANSINTQIVNLEGIQYKLRFIWCYRENRWYMDIFTIDDIIIIGGIKLTVNYELIGFFVVEGKPPGFMILANQQNVDYQVKEEINNDFQLLYITSDDPLVG